MKAEVVSQSQFSFLILLLGFVYLSFQFFFIPYCILAADEFVFARHIYDYTVKIPYYDFSPYKTVLGYYLLALPMLFSKTILYPMFYIKYEIALLNMVACWIIFFSTKHWFARGAILISAFAMFANPLFLTHSASLRVDILAAWLGIFSFLLFLSHRHLNFSGFLMGLGFLVSQKIIWYFLAINGAFMIGKLAFSESIFNWRSWMRFNAYTILTICLYICFWLIFIKFHQGSSSEIFIFKTLCTNIFGDAYTQANINFYLPSFFIYWWSMLQSSPALFLWAPITGIMIFDHGLKREEMHRYTFIFLFCMMVLYCFINYKQPFPYNFIVIAPIFFLLYANFFTYLFRDPDRIKIFYIQILNFSCFLSLTLYLYLILALIFFTQISWINYGIVLLPLSVLGFGYFSTHQKNEQSKICFWITCNVFTFFAMIIPLYNMIHDIKNYNGRYQQTMIQLGNLLLQDKSSYLGGIPFIYQIDQSLFGLENMITPLIFYLEAPTPELKSLLLPSLYLYPITKNKVLLDFKNQPIKIIMNNYRIGNLPLEIKNYIRGNYSHFWGSIYIYAPIIQHNEKDVLIKFTGRYRIAIEEVVQPLTRKNEQDFVIIDRKKYFVDEIVFLKKGMHQFFGKSNFRLILSPENVGLNEFKKNAHWADQPEKMVRNILI